MGPDCDERTPEELIADGDQRWPDGRLYLPPHLRGRERRQYLRRLLILEPEDAQVADQRCLAFIRAGGDVLCPQCGHCYCEHPDDVQETSLTLLCDRSRVKL